MIGGNITASIQSKTITKNVIGEMDKKWEEKAVLKGWLDFSSGDSRRTDYYAKVEEATHVFVADYAQLDISPETERLVADGKVFDILDVDNPMGLNKQLEIYLRYTGGRI